MKGLSLEDPNTTILRHKIIREKAFLRKLYAEWYKVLMDQISAGEGRVLELGSGGGFLGEMQSNCITSEVFYGPDVDVVLDGCSLPFADSTLASIVMVDVLHHIPDVRKFFVEAERTLKPGGVMSMIEPWLTSWSTFVYKHFHSEPFEPEAKEWSFPSSGPLSGANGALPWIVFRRDLDEFHSQFPGLRVESLKLDYPFSYLVSGGVSLRSFVPGWCYGFCRSCEHLFSPFMGGIAMFAHIVVRRLPDDV